MDHKNKSNIILQWNTH